jgi:hypothetical protein
MYSRALQIERLLEISQAMGIEFGLLALFDQRFCEKSGIDLSVVEMRL